MKIRKYVVLSHICLADRRENETILLVDEQSFTDECNDPGAFVTGGNCRYIRTIEICGEHLHLLPDVFVEEKN